MMGFALKSNEECRMTSSYQCIDCLCTRLFFNLFLHAQGDDFQYLSAMSVRPKEQVEKKLRKHLGYDPREIS